MKSVIIADDSPMLLDVITEQIDSMNIFDSIIQVNNGLELLEEFRKTPTDLLLVDIVMPKMSGFDVVKKIRAINKDVKILIISNFVTDEIIIKSLFLGANGYVSKIEFVEMFDKAIKTIKQNNLFFPQEIIDRANNNTTNYLTGLECYEIKKRLSNREHEVFTLLGKINECIAIAEKLKISKRTVENHIEKIKNELNFKSKSELSRIATIHYSAYGC